MTTVLRLIRASEIALHRAQLCDWLTANGIDPKTVRDTWISVEEIDGSAPVIRYPAFKVDSNGRRMVDPDDETQSWTEQRTGALTVALPELNASSVAGSACSADPPEQQAHGTNDTYPYGGDYEAGVEYTLICYCGREFTGELDGTVEAEHEQHMDDVANGLA